MRDGENGDYLVILLVDPNTLDGLGRTAIKGRIHILTNRPYVVLISDIKRPGSLVLAEGIVAMSLHPFDQHLVEIRQRYEEYNCALCGGRISRGLCLGCQARFPKSLSGHFFLPTQVVEMLQNNGFTFRHSPDEARKKEKEIWERTYGFKH